MANLGVADHTWLDSRRFPRVGAPQPVQAQLGILGAIQAVLNVINGAIQTALTSINSVRTAVNNLQQLVAWPQQLINQARAQVTQMIGQYCSLMGNIFHIKLNRATLPNPQALEAVIRDHQVNNFPNLMATFANVYGAIPVATAANPSDRAMDSGQLAITLYCDIGLSLDRGGQSIVFIKVRSPLCGSIVAKFVSLTRDLRQNLCGQAGQLWS